MTRPLEHILAAVLMEHGGKVRVSDKTLRELKRQGIDIVWGEDPVQGGLVIGFRERVSDKEDKSE